jgi:hypothetical protein
MIEERFPKKKKLAAGNESSYHWETLALINFVLYTLLIMCWPQNIAIIILEKRIEPMGNFMERPMARSTQDDFGGLIKASTLA